MNGYDVSRYEYAKDKASALGFEIMPSGDAIRLYEGERMLCSFANVAELLQWLCGYEWGIEMWRNGR